MRNVLLILFLISFYNFVFSQVAPTSYTITRTSPNPAISCNSVNFHVTATNNSSTAQTIIVEIYTPGIAQISSSAPYSHSTHSGVEHFYFSLGSVPASHGGTTVSFDFSYNIDCSVIPEDLSHPSSSYTTSSILTSFAGITTYTTSQPNVTTNYDWVNLYYATIAPTLGLIQYSHLGETITRSIRVNVGSSSSIIQSFNGVVQFQDDMSGSCNMGDATAVTLSIFDDVSGASIGSPIIGIETSPSSNIFNFTMPATPITTDQYIVFTETVLIIPEVSNTCLENCGASHALKSELRIHWGCKALTDILPTPCHSINVEALVYKDLALPNLEIIESPIPAEGCLDVAPGFVSHTKRITNTGTVAHDINVRLQTELEGGTYLPSTEFIFDGPGEITTSGSPATILGYTYHSLGAHSTVSSCAQSLSASGHGNAIQTADINVPILNPGDYVDVTFKTYYCCPSDHDAIVGNYEDPEYFDTWELSVNGFSECDIEVQGIRREPNSGQKMLDLTQRPIPGPTHLIGATFPDGCNLSNTATYHIQNLVFNDEEDPAPFPYRNAQLFEDVSGGPIHGTLRVKITTQLGLTINYTGTEISLQDNPTSTPITPRSFVQTSSLGTSGGTWEIKFRLQDLTSDPLVQDYRHLKEFLDFSVFNFPLTPCCPGEEIPTYTLEWDINPYNDETGTSSTLDSRSCQDCWIPIAKSKGKIHLMCPGCVTPGVIVDYAHLRRASFGWPDDNNNGLANAIGTTGTPYTDLADLTARGGYPYAERYFMPGDNLTCDIRAVGQDGDNTNHGFNYATLKAEWALHSPSPKFEFLTMYITDPCLANWELNTSTTSLSLNGATPILINGYKHASSTSTAWIYNIPYAALGITEYDLSDVYTIHFDYRVCTNAPPGDCEHTVIMWWSTQMHSIADVSSVPPAGDPNEDLVDPLLTAADRASDLVTNHPNLRWFCEGNGALLHGYQIKKTYTSRWSNNTLGGTAWHVNTCGKLCTNTIRLKLIDETPGVNFFWKEYRPIDPNFISDNYIEPPITPPNYIYNHTAYLSSTYTYTSSGHVFLHSITNTSTLAESAYSSSGAMIYSFSPPLPAFNIARDASFPFSSFPTPDRISDASDANFYMGDENTELILKHYYSPSTCPAPIEHPPLTVSNDGNYASIGNNSCITTPSEDIFNVPTPIYVLKKSNPTLALRLDGTTISVFKMTPTCFKIILKNISHDDEMAENAFLYIPAPFPASTINAVTRIDGVAATCTASGPIVPNNYFIVNIPALRRTESCTLEVCFTLDPCVFSTTFNFPITYGYSCLGAVENPADVSVACHSQVLTLTPHPAKVIITGRVTYPTSIARCSTANIVADYWVTDIGQVNNIHLLVTLPTGASVMSSSVSIGTPGGISFSVSGLSITPTYDSPSTGFTTYDIMLPGTTILPLGPASMARIRFTIQIGACISGSITPKLRLLANTYCNDDIYFPPLSSSPFSHAIPIIGSAGPNCLPLKIDLVSKTDATCIGKNDGSIYISVTHTTSPPPGLSFIHYHWSNGGTLDHITGLAPGTYSVTVTDVYGCEQVASYTILPLTNPIILPTITHQPYTTCELISLNNTISFNPGAGTYKYEWTATNIPTGSVASGIIPTGGPYSFNLDFDNSTMGSEVSIKVIDNSIPTDPHPCYDILKLWIEPCCDRSEILISNSDAEKEFSGFPLTGSGFYDVTGTNYRVNGILNINHDTRFSGVTFYMEPFSQIRVNAGHTGLFKGCVLVACDTTMWKGIVAEASSSLEIQYTRVYDAIAGVTTINNGTYAINSFSNFNRNYIDIDVGELSTTPNLSTITQSNLFCSAEATEYFGNHSYPGKLWYPYKDTTTFIGIKVLNNFSLQIGDNGLLPNYISDKHFGIYSLNSALDVYNNVLSNILQFPSIVTTSGSVPASAGDAINFGVNAAIGTYPKNLFADNNVFNTPITHACIYLYGFATQATIQNNTMNGVFGILSNNLGTHYIASIPTFCDYKPINIKQNTINYSSGGAGIRLENTYRIEANIDVSNKINGPTFDPGYPNSIGIYISSLSTMSRDIPRFSIINNIINNGRVGISIQNIVPYTGLGAAVCGTYSSSIRLNTIKNTDNTVSNYVGIGLNNAHKILIGCNTLIGINSFITDGAKKNQAILLNESRGNQVTCNDMDKFYRGFSYIGDCSMPNQLAGNKFHDLGSHIYTNGAGYKIGDQVNIGGAFPANEMANIPLVPGRYSIFNGGNPYLYAKRTFYPYNPNTSGFLGGSMDPAHLPTASSTMSNYDCFLSCPMGMPSGGDSSYMESAGGSEVFAIEVKKSTDISYSEEDEGTMKLNEELLYSILKNDTSLLENDTLEGFYEEKKEEHTGKLSEINELIGNEAYTEAETKIDVLPLSNEAEEANKTVYEILNKIKQREKYILTNEEIGILQVIAANCPVKYGQAVFSARVLISTQYGYEGSYWNDDELCSLESRFRKSNPVNSEQTEINPRFIIFPNPASSELNFKLKKILNFYDNEKTKIEILDILGNIVYTKEFNEIVQAGKLNISNLANGAYLVKYFFGNNEIYHESFVVNR